MEGRSTVEDRRPRNSYHRVCYVLCFICRQGLNWGIPPDLRSGASCLRSTTSNNRSCTSQLRSGTFLAGFHHSAEFIFEYFSLGMMFCRENVILHGHFVICICQCCQRQTPFILSNAIEAKQSALNARKPLVGGREPHLCSRPFKPRACRDALPLVE